MPPKEKGPQRAPLEEYNSPVSHRHSTPEQNHIQENLTDIPVPWEHVSVSLSRAIQNWWR